MENEVSENLKMFIKKERWEYKFPLTTDIRLYEDLNIYGNDAVNFLLAFGREFKVDVSKFKAGDYFKGEGLDFLTPIINLLHKGNKTPSIRIRKSLTLGHLEKAIAAGKLDEDIINS